MCVYDFSRLSGFKPRGVVSLWPKVYVLIQQLPLFPNNSIVGYGSNPTLVNIILIGVAGL